MINMQDYPWLWLISCYNLLLCHPNFSPQYSCQITRSTVALIIVQVCEDQTKQHQPSPQPDKGNSPQHYHLCADWRIVSKQKLWQFFVESSLFSALFSLLRMRGYKNCWSWVLCQDAEIMNERIKMLWRHQPCQWYKILLTSISMFTTTCWDLRKHSSLWVSFQVPKTLFLPCLIKKHYEWWVVNVANNYVC